MVAVVPYGTGSSQMACSETGSPSSVQLKMTGVTLSTFLDKAEFLARPTSSSESSLPLSIPLGFGHGILLRNGLVHKVMIIVRLIKIKPLIEIPV
jgi:hypothetical protein